LARTTVREFHIVHLQKSSVDSLLGRRVEAKLDDLWWLWRVENGQLLQDLDLGLDLRRTIGVVSEAIDEDLDVISVALLRFIVPQLLLVSLSSGLLEGIVVSLVIVQRPGAQMDDISTHGIQITSIVRNCEQRIRPVL